MATSLETPIQMAEEQPLGRPPLRMRFPANERTMFGEETMTDDSACRLWRTIFDPRTLRETLHPPWQFLQMVASHNESESGGVSPSNLTTDKLAHMVRMACYQEAPLSRDIVLELAFQQIEFWSRNQPYQGMLRRGIFLASNRYDIGLVSYFAYPHHHIAYIPPGGVYMSQNTQEVRSFFEDDVDLDYDEWNFEEEEPELPQLSEEEQIRARAREYRLNEHPEPSGLPESEDLTEEGSDDIPDDIQCGLCGREIALQFNNCSHAACTACVKNLWWSRVSHPDHFPSWITCPWCRAEITTVGILEMNQWPEVATEVKHGDSVFTITVWEDVANWVTRKSRRVALRAIMNCMEA